MYHEFAYSITETFTSTAFKIGQKFIIVSKRLSPHFSTSKVFLSRIKSPTLRKLRVGETSGFGSMGTFFRQDRTTIKMWFYGHLY